MIYQFHELVSILFNNIILFHFFRILNSLHWSRICIPYPLISLKTLSNFSNFFRSITYDLSRISPKIQDWLANKALYFFAFSSLWCFIWATTGFVGRRGDLFLSLQHPEDKNSWVCLHFDSRNSIVFPINTRREWAKNYWRRQKNSLNILGNFKSYWKESLTDFSLSTHHPQGSFVILIPC